MKNLIAQANQTNFNLAPQNAGTANFSQLTKISIPTAISALISIALVVAIIVFFFMLIIGGIRWILSGGDKGQTEAARNQVTAALIGLVVVFAAWAIAQLLGSLFGITIFSTGVILPTFF